MRSIEKIIENFKKEVESAPLIIITLRQLAGVPLGCLVTGNSTNRTLFVAYGNCLHLPTLQITSLVVLGLARLEEQCTYFLYIHGKK